MKKIIILSDTGQSRYGLVSQLKKLFPECEIQIFQRRFNSIEKYKTSADRVFDENKSVECVV